MTEKDRPSWKKKVDLVLSRRNIKKVEVQPRKLEEDFQSPKFPPEGNVAEHVSVIQTRSGSGSLAQPTTSRPAFVNLQMGPKLIKDWNRKPKKRKPDPSSDVRRTSSFDEYERNQFQAWRQEVESGQRLANEEPDKLPPDEQETESSPDPLLASTSSSGPSSVFPKTSSPPASTGATTPAGTPNIPPILVLMAQPKTIVCYEKFFGKKKEDAETYLKEFEAAATTNNQATDQEKATIFGGFMKGRAQKWHSRLSNKNDWTRVKDAFLKRFQEDGAAARSFAKIAQLRMKKGGSVRTYFDKLMDLINKYNPATSNDTIKDWFINGLPPSMYRYVIRLGASTLKEAQAAAQTFTDSALTDPKKVRKALKKEKSSRKHKKHQSSSSSDEDSDSDTSDITSDSSSSMTSSSSSSSDLYKKRRSKHKKNSTVNHLEKMVEKLTGDFAKKLSVNNATLWQRRRSPHIARSNVWCTKCNGHGHYPRECPTGKEALYVETDDEDGFNECHVIQNTGTQYFPPPKNISRAQGPISIPPMGPLAPPKLLRRAGQPVK